MISELMTFPETGVPDAETVSEAAAPAVRLRGGRGGVGGAAENGDADKSAGDVERLLGFAGRRDRAHQNDGIGDRLDLDVVVGDRGAQQFRQFGDVAADRHFDDRDLPPVLVEREDRRLAVGDRVDIKTARRANDRVRDAGLADEYFAGLFGKIDITDLPTPSCSRRATACMTTGCVLAASAPAAGATNGAGARRAAASTPAEAAARRLTR